MHSIPYVAARPRQGGPAREHLHTLVRLTEEREPLDVVVMGVRHDGRRRHDPPKRAEVRHLVPDTERGEVGECGARVHQDTPPGVVLEEQRVGPELPESADRHELRHQRPPTRR